MSEVKIAKRYAKAALESAIERNLFEVFSDDFILILDALKVSRELRLLFKSPIITKNTKLSIIDQVFKKKINKESLKYIRFLVYKSRDNLIREILETFFQLKNEHFGILEAKVSAFHQLRKNQIENLQKKLESLTSKKVNINFGINKELIGGLMVQVGDTVLDGSLRRKLEMLKEYISK